MRAEKARDVLRELEYRDVARGGVWSASVGVWQRYDVPWNGPIAGRGDAKLVGTIAVAYGTPTQYDVTIYRATITQHGAESGWSVEGLCDDALQYGGLTLATCPRTQLVSPPLPDPFKAS